MTGTSRWWATESVLLRNGWKRNMACSEIKNGVFVSVFLSPRAYPLTKFLFLRSFVEGVLSHSQLIRSATDFPTWPFLVICIVRRYPHPSYGIFLYEMPYHADFWYLFFDWFWLRIWSGKISGRIAIYFKYLFELPIYFVNLISVRVSVIMLIQWSYFFCSVNWKNVRSCCRKVESSIFAI